MGVHQVFRLKAWHQDAGLDSAAASSLLEKVVQCLHPRDVRPWSVKGTVWRQHHVQVDDNNNMMKFQGSLKDVLVFDFDARDGGTVLLDRAETGGVPCTSNMHEVLRSMRYVNSIQMTFAGREFDLGDFVVRVGTVVRKSNDEAALAVILAVHYLPCRHVLLTAPLLLEVQQLLEANLARAARHLRAPPTLERMQPASSATLGDVFSPGHLALLYWQSIRGSSVPEAPVAAAAATTAAAARTPVAA